MPPDPTPPSSPADAADAEILPLLLLPADWASRFGDTSTPASWLDPLQAVLPAYLAQQRWFAAKSRALGRIAIVRQLLWKQRWLLLRIDVELRDDPAQTYWLPLAIAWSDDRDAGLGHGEAIAPADTLARVRQQERSGMLIDAFADARFCRALLAAIGRQEIIDTGAGRLEFTATAAFARLAGDDPERLAVRRAGASSSNTTLLFGDTLFLKAYRRLSAGVNPEVEMGRFLTEASPYAHIAPFAGMLALRGRDGTSTALAMLQGCIASQGDAWSHTLANLAALIDEALASPGSDGARCDARHAGEARRWATLGRRTGELHRALARTTGDAAFDPEPISATMLRRWTQQVGDEAAQTLDQLAGTRPDLPAALQLPAQRLLTARPALLERIASLLPEHIDAQITRYHGDFHLGQLLVVGDDFVIIDFEGEPSRPLEQRRSKHSPLRDVAGLLRSLNYAANSALGEALAARRAPAEMAKTAGTLAALLDDWEARARTAYLAAYRDAVRDCPAYPKDPQASARLLELFLFEKAFYELRYELAHRPDWVHVPLGGLSRLLPHG